MKYSFKNDYSEGAHPAILQMLVEINRESLSGYGTDQYTTEAKELIKKSIGNQHAEVFFVSGGTQANLIVISALLRPHESVIAVETAHINEHEAGAIEATGHKIHVVKSDDGKLNVKSIQSVLDANNLAPHTSKPKLVYISNSTELGTVYKKQELAEIAKFCREKNLLLFLDGARLGAALSSLASDITLEDIGQLVDIFYIGGTKNGALYGEAIVINHAELQKDFAYSIKQKGALLSKGWVLGVQFIKLFENDLFLELARHANDCAKALVDGLVALDIDFLTMSPTNQVFPIFHNSLISQLEVDYGFYVWKKIDEVHSAVRLVTSWATQKESIEEFLNDVRRLKGLN